MLPSNYQLPAGVILVAVGLLACFAGYRLLRAVLTIYGFLLGALFASTLVAPSDTVAMLIAVGVGGLVGALALFFGYYAGVALVGGGLGATVSHSVWMQWRGTDPGTLVVLFFAAVGAALAVTLQRVIVIVATSFLGAQTVVAGVLALLSRQSPRRGLEAVWIGHLGIPAAGRQWPFLAWVALGVIGAAVQLSSGGGKRPKSKK
jgi:hypothetical protein